VIHDLISAKYLPWLATSELYNMQNSCTQQKIRILPKHYHFVARILLGSPSRSRDIILTKCPNRICCCIPLQSSPQNKFLTYTLVRPKLGLGERRGKLVITAQTYNLDPKRIQCRVRGSVNTAHYFEGDDVDF
jgi:hypothetical protein